MIRLPNHILSADFETTGIVPAYDHPTALSVVEFIDGEPTGAVFTRKLVPGVKAKISIEALMVQGMKVGDALKETLEKLFPEDAITAKECMGQLTKWTHDNNLNHVPVVAQKASFDWGFFCEKLEINRSVHMGDALSPLWICTKTLACHLWPDKTSKSLDNILIALGLEPRRSAGHDAQEDAIKCGEAYFGMRALLYAKDAPTKEPVTV